MLQNLHVKNLALIEEAEVDFKPGLNILSGETGAGKSIIIGSINLALGEKVQKEMLRENEENALVELVFSVENEAQKKALEEMDVFLEDDCVILSRRIANGRGVAKINGESVPASKMRDVAALLIDIHGQHEHQSLLHKKKHLEILDAFAKEALSNKKEALTEAYAEYKKLLTELNTADVNEEDRLREISFLEYEIKEISEANLQENEDVTVEEEYKRYSNGKKIMEALNMAYQYSGNGSENASDFTSRAIKELSQASAFDDKVRELEAQILEIDNLLNDFNREIADYIDDTEFDDETFFELEKRLDEINHLKSKYGKTIPEILNALGEKEARLEKLQDYDCYLADLKKKVNEAEEVVGRFCMEISEIRKDYAKTLVFEVTNALKDLNFLDVRFEMQFDELSDYTANGIDDPEFLISTNPGEPVKPLGKVASGGELSRIMLAIKTVLADNDDIETLIFDEIDSGISGRTAQMVSEKMNVLGRNHQIICITHLPQIAAMADAHYLIEKSVENQTTVSKIRLLNEEESINELSRMLGGVEITDKVKESAREMKELAKKRKTS